MRVLGIDVDDALLDLWNGWLMPSTQPFVLPRSFVDHRGWIDVRSTLPREIVDSFELYGLKPDDAVVLVSRRESRLLPPALRYSSRTPHRWPTESPEKNTAGTIAYVERRRRFSRHLEVRSLLTAVSGVLPGALAIAGTFARRSGPNCFGAVMAVAGVDGAADQWMEVAPFEDWLATHASRGGKDDEPGTVFVWRTADNSAVHAAVTLGDGWLLHKPSQGWMSPTKVLSVRDGKLSARSSGHRLARYTLNNGAKLL